MPRKIYTEKWLSKFREKQSRYEVVKLKPQKEKLEPGDKDSEYSLKNTDKKFPVLLADLGIVRVNHITEDLIDTEVPESNGVPRVFIVENGKISTLKEKNIALGSRAFTEAVLKGQIFAYPSGEKDPVQLQARKPVGKEWRNHMVLGVSAPVKSFSNDGQLHSIELPEEPKVPAPPRWYHYILGRSKVAAYQKAVQKHEAWVKECEKLTEMGSERVEDEHDLGKLIRKKFGALRTEDALTAELNSSFEHSQKVRDLENELNLSKAEEKVDQVDKGMEFAMNLYAPKPQIRKDWVASEAIHKSNSRRKMYTEEEFNTLTSEDIELEKMQLGGKPVSEKDFTAAAIFSALDPDIGVKAQADAVGDPTPVIEGFKGEGYTEDQAKDLVTGSICTGYTVDILHNDERSSKYFKSACNGGRAIAADAIKAYNGNPPDKSKMANIISRAVEMTGMQVGTSSDYGVIGLTEFCGNMLEIMERDPELKQLAKAQYEAREKAKCEVLNAQFGKDLKAQKEYIKPKSFEERIADIKAYKNFKELETKGLKATVDLQRANKDGIELSADKKKSLVKDILTANMAVALYKNQVKDNKMHKNDEGTIALEQYVKGLKEKQAQAGIKQAGLGSTGGSSLPGSAPTVIMSALENRFLPKPAIMYQLLQEKNLLKLQHDAEIIMEQDGMNELNTEDLCKKLKPGSMSKYAGDKMILRTAQIAEQQKAPEDQKEKQNIQKTGTGIQAGV